MVPVSELDQTARTYVRGFDGLSRMGQLGRLSPDLAVRMAKHVAKDAPDTAMEMTRRFDDARWDLLMDVSSDIVRVADLRRRDVERDRLARRAGMTRAEIDRVAAGGHDRAIVEARAALYRI